jgi:hypothetical protein
MPWAAASAPMIPAKAFINMARVGTDWDNMDGWQNPRAKCARLWCLPQ